jgi:hypothetical protein
MFGTVQHVQCTYNLWSLFEYMVPHIICCAACISSGQLRFQFVGRRGTALAINVDFVCARVLQDTSRILNSEFFTQACCHKVTI